MTWHRVLIGLALIVLCTGAVRSQEAAEVRIDLLGAELTVGEEAWQPLFQGVKGLALAADQPRRLRGQALRIDLEAPGLKFFVSPSNGERPLESDSITTSHFLEQHRLQAAINSAPFSPVVSDEGIPQDVVGVAISRGEVVSGPQEGYGALYITADNRVTIGPQEAGLDLSGYENACGGFQIILKEGVNIAPDDALHPRSAAGLDTEGRHLFLLVIDGRQPGHSEGVTQKELADWLRKLGCHTGLNLDGGGSSSLVIQNGEGRPRILNRPIHKGKPGTERPCPNHLGVFARPLEREDKR